MTQNGGLVASIASIWLEKHFAPDSDMLTATLFLEWLWGPEKEPNFWAEYSCPNSVPRQLGCSFPAPIYGPENEPTNEPTTNLDRRATRPERQKHAFGRKFEKCTAKALVEVSPPC